jgi:quinol monooxygenase YgiN
MVEEGHAMDAQPAAGADEAGNAAVYVVSYLEVVPPATGEAAALLRQYREASRTEDGGVRFDVLQQRSRHNHFTLVEIWKDQRAREAHAMAAHTRQFREQFQPMTGSLYDERLYRALG